MPDTTEKKTIPRGPAATAAKNKYRDNNYDRMELAVPKGMKARIKEIAKEQGYSSQNNYVVEAVKEKYQRDTGEELTWQKEEKNRNLKRAFCMAGTVRNVYIIQTKSAYITMTQKHRATIATTTQGRHNRKGE